MDRNPQCIIAVLLVVLVQRGVSLQCYSCRPESVLRCEYSSQIMAVECDAYYDTCWKFAGNTTVAGVTYVGQITRMCARVSDLRRWSPGVIYADTCTNVNNIRSPDGQLFTGRICLCDDKNLCNGGTTVKMPAALLVFVALYALSLFVS